MTTLDQLKRIIEVEFYDVLANIGTEIHHGKLRAFIFDGSYIDIWLSEKISGRFSFHWERDILMLQYTDTTISPI